MATYTTAKFVVHICESYGTGETYYRGRNRETGDRIDLPAELGDSHYYATNGQYTYVIGSDALEVYENEERILYDRVLSVT